MFAKQNFEGGKAGRTRREFRFFLNYDIIQGSLKGDRFLQEESPGNIEQGSR